MEVRFWGVRGSIPVPGAQTGRWGGNSSCVEVCHEGFPTLVLDCGTGARALGQKLVQERHREAVVLFTHLHADHVFGFPFFLPLYAPGWTLRVGVPAHSDDEAQAALARYVNGVFHPMRLRELPSAVSYFAVRTTRPVAATPWVVRAARLNHPGGAVGYRIEAGGRSIAYITDTGPFAQPGEGVAAGESPTAAERRIGELIKGCDLVIFDTMFEYEEYLERMTWGHSYAEYAIALCAWARVGKLVLFHHPPDGDDDALDARERRLAEGAPIPVVGAREGMVITV